MLCDIALLTSLEALLGITCACLPFLKPVLHKLNTTKSFKSGSIPIVMRASQTTTRVSGKKQYDILTSATDPSRCEEQAKGDREIQASV